MILLLTAALFMALLWAENSVVTRYGYTPTLPLAVVPLALIVCLDEAMAGNPAQSAGAMLVAAVAAGSLSEARRAHR